MLRQWRQTGRYLKIRCRDILSADNISSCTNERKGLLCLQPFYFIEITTAGDAYTCCPGWIRFPIGNIRNKTIEEIWNSKRARFIRRKMHRGEWQNICNPICPRISEYKHEGKLIEYDYLEALDFLTPQLVNEIQMNKEYLDSSPTVFNLSNSTACNLSCIMCDRVNQHNDLQLIQKTAQDISAYLPSARRLILTGMGDPFARLDTRRLLIEFKSENPDFAFDIITNGLLLPRYWDQIKHQKFCNLQISVDASKKETYEKIRIGGRWEDLLESLNLVRENKHSFRSIIINMTVMRYNYNEIPAFIDLAESYGFDVSFQRVRGDFCRQNFFETNDGRIIYELRKYLKAEQEKKRAIRIYWGDLLEFLPDKGLPALPSAK